MYFKTILLTAFLIALPTLALANSVTTSPLGLHLLPETKVSSFDIKNNENIPVRFEGVGLNWSQVAGKNIYTPSTNLRVIPAMAIIAPGSTQTFRVARMNASSDSEQAFRVRFHQLPVHGATVDCSEKDTTKISIECGSIISKTGVNAHLIIMIDETLPVFYANPNMHSNLSVHFDKNNLVVKNDGTATARLSLLGSDGSIWNAGLLGYVLPGSTMSFPVGHTANHITVQVNNTVRNLDVK